MERLLVFGMRRPVASPDPSTLATRHGYRVVDAAWNRRDGRIVGPVSDGELELFTASDSSRWTHNDLRAGRLFLGREPLWEPAAAAAATWYRTHVPDSVSRFIVGPPTRQSAQLARGRPRSIEPLQRVLAQVATSYRVNGIELIGPGAKTVVSVDGLNRVVQACHFWHDVFEQPLFDARAWSPDDALNASRDQRIQSLNRQVPPRRVYYMPPPRQRATLVLPFYQWLVVPDRIGHIESERRAANMLLPAIRLDEVPESRRGEARDIARALHTLI